MKRVGQNHVIVMPSQRDVKRRYTLQCACYEHSVRFFSSASRSFEMANPCALRETVWIIVSWATKGPSVSPVQRTSVGASREALSLTRGRG